MKGKGTGIDKTILKKQNKVEEVSLLDFKTFYIPTVMKTLWY